MIDEREGLYHVLVEAVQDYAIFMLDPSGQVVSWNDGAERIMGYRAEEIVGRHFSAFYPPEAIAEDKPGTELEIAARTGRVEDEGWRVRKEGSRFWANTVITRLHSPHGEVIGFAKVTRDLTERRAAEERAIAAARRAAESEAANRAKSEFLAAMSHELRTPLNAIGGYVELLILGIGGTLSEQQQRYLERIRASQQHLLGIINDILNFSRIEAGEITYEIGSVSVFSVVERVALMVEPQAKAKGLQLDRWRGCDLVAHADRMKVEQILLNLLSNAVKFTDSGGHIELGCASAGEYVTLYVRDTGIGIARDKLEAIFEPFVQVGRSLTNPHEGTGLGLAISRDLARAMGGDLTVESTLGQGSTFTLSLPTE